MFESSLKGIFTNIAISLLLLFGGCAGDSDGIGGGDNGGTTGKTERPTNKAPIFTNVNTKSVNENLKSAIKLKANDGDQNTLTYSISDDDADSFDINSSSGLVEFKIAPDYEAKRLYKFNATVSDGEKSATIEMTININNLDDTKQGQLIDSAISGVEYETNSGSTGKTDDSGTFKYDVRDKTITFKIGKLIIAKDFNLSKINSDGKILPSDIAEVVRNNTTSQKIVKLLKSAKTK